MVRAPPYPRPKKLKSPVEDPSIIEEWKELYNYYTKVEGMRKWDALERIVYEYGGRSASNIRHWIEPKVRERENIAKKTR